jgi:hypothetical protein
MHVRLDRVDRTLDDHANANGGREVVDAVVVERRKRGKDRRHRALDHPVARDARGLRADDREVAATPCREVVDHGHGVAAIEEKLGQVRADEAAAAGHQHAKRCMRRRHAAFRRKSVLR